LTVDEELSLLDDNLRRLKIEYDVYFGGGAKKAPAELEWRVQTTIKKFQDGRMSGAQRFKYNTLVNKYAIFNSLWQKKLRIKEEGYRRPQDAILAIQGVRQNPAAEAELKANGRGLLAVTCSDPENDRDRLRQLYEQTSCARNTAATRWNTPCKKSLARFASRPNPRRCRKRNLP
jgi:hypothetical protein